MTLHEYATEGDLANLRARLERGAPVDERTDGWTPLMQAAQSDRAGVDVLEALLDHGADVNAIRESKSGEDSPLSLAIKAGDSKKIEHLLVAGADVAYRTASGYDALLDAVYARSDANLDLFRLLVDRGARVDGISKYGETAVKVASRNVRMDVVGLLLEHGADGEPLGWGPLSRAVALGTVSDVEAALLQGADAERRDCWLRTPWMLSLVVGDLEKAKLLLEAGVGSREPNLGGRSALSIAATAGNARLIEWLIDEGFGLEEPDSDGLTPLMLAAASGHVDSVRMLVERGANVHIRHEGTTAVSSAEDLETLEILLAAGGDIADTSEAMRRELRGQQSDALPKVSHEEFRSDKQRRFGFSNPELMNVPFWRFMVLSGLHAYGARTRFGDDPSADDAPVSPEPVWCYSRFGQSITLMERGCLVEIGGEHEDYYDADFCIYNDVVVRRGGTLEIYGYPEEVFPPTDFHTSTPFDGSIYIVGSLGYLGQRDYGTTPVYRLDCKTFAMERVVTTGECPGWIHKHQARLDGAELVVHGGIVVTSGDEEEAFTDNPDTFALDFSTRRWRRRE